MFELACAKCRRLRDTRMAKPISLGFGRCDMATEDSGSASQLYALYVAFFGQRYDHSALGLETHERQLRSQNAQPTLRLLPLSQ